MAKPDQQAESILGAILDKKADISPPHMTLTSERVGLRLAYSTPLYKCPMIFIYKTEGSIQASLDMSGLLSFRIVSMILGISFFWIILKNALVRAPLPQSFRIPLKKLKSASHVQIFLAYGILLGCLSSYVVILFNRPVEVKPPFTDAASLLDRIENREYETIFQYKQPMMLLSGSRQLRETSISRRYKAVFEKYPPIVRAELITVLRQMLSSTKKYVFITDEMKLRAIMSEFCGLSYIIDTYFSPSWHVIYMAPELRANFSIGEIESALYMREFERLTNRYYLKKTCPTQEKEYFVIELNQIVMAFYMLAVFQVAGAIVLLLEQGVDHVIFALLKHVLEFPPFSSTL